MKQLLLLAVLLSGCEKASAPAQQIVTRQTIAVPGSMVEWRSGAVQAPPINTPALAASFRETREDQIELVASPKTPAAVTMQLGVLDRRVKAALDPLTRRHAQPTPTQIQNALIEVTTLRTYLAIQKSRPAVASHP